MEKLFYFIFFALFYLIISSTTRVGFVVLVITTSCIQLLNFVCLGSLNHPLNSNLLHILDLASLASLLAVLFAAIMRSSAEYRLNRH